MKKLRSEREMGLTKRAVCTVSAAALMLGVSHAATVGFNFQAHYCGTESYSGAIVTAPAFGIGTNAWENLSQMDTGYGSCAATNFTLSETIDTASSSNGLNRLPNGSLNVTWSGNAANVSGFGGYSRPGPHYTFGGNSYKPGNEQVYWGFIRDGVNFGPGRTGGDNSQPGYSIDITGLKSLFTNSSFAVQLIASADSMQYLTNAFIIDATANSTQSVVYPSTPPVGDSGDTAWVRGIGGGLSTSSGALNTDHLKIIGNRAAHAGDKTNGYNFGSTISGFIITDKPVITMPPQQVVVSSGDTVTWSGYACGASPLSYQWRKNGTPITGATSTSYSITNVSSAHFAAFDLLVSNAYGVAISSPVTVDSLSAVSGKNYLTGSNTAGPREDGLAFAATWLASNSDSAGITRTDVMRFTATNQSQVTVSGSTNFDSATGTLMFWVRSAGLNDPSGKQATVFDRQNGNGMVVVQNSDGTLELKTSQGAQDLNSANVSDDKWHHIAATYDQSANGQMILYVDGQLASSGVNSAVWSWQAGQEIELGLSHDTNSWQALNSVMDDVRLYNRVLTAAEITSAFGGALVDTNALVLRMNFDAAPAAGVTLNWLTSDAILQSADSPSGPYTDVPGAVAPRPISRTGGQQGTAKFYRYRGHTPKKIVSNPYLM